MIQLESKATDRFRRDVIVRLAAVQRQLSHRAYGFHSAERRGRLSTENRRAGSVSRGRRSQAGSFGGEAPVQCRRRPTYNRAVPRRPPIVLAYHGIVAVNPAHDPVRLFVAPDSFRAQVRVLKKRGYRLVKMAEFAAETAGGGGTPPDGLAALTFDDGTDDHANSLPGLLEELDVPGTVYCCPGLLGAPYPWADPALGARFMTRPEFDRTAAHPLIEIGSHTINHTVLEQANAATALQEMRDCRLALEAMTAAPVLSFCYPRCLYSEPCPAAAIEAGYTSAVTCGPRGSWAPGEMQRQCIHTPDGRLVFELKLRGRYDRLRSVGPAPAVRALTRPWRHRAER